MKRTLTVMFCIALAGCRLPEEREGLRPLPEKGPPLSYKELHNRTKIQADAALAAFYGDNWLELEQISQVLEQSARYLPNATDQPDKLKKSLAKEAEALGQQAARLREAAKARNVQTINETLQQIHLIVRALRPNSD